MKILWCGSDVLFSTLLVGGKKFPTKNSKFIYFAGMTLFAKLADKFVECHYVVAEHLIRELQPLKLRKPIKVLADPAQSVTDVVRMPHEGFNILYYIPKSNNKPFTDWVYGEDIVRSLIAYYGDLVNFVIVDGSQDMKTVYQTVDFCLRCNRHDGNPRIIMECEQLGIPYYWSKESPDVSDIIYSINKAIYDKSTNGVRN